MFKYPLIYRLSLLIIGFGLLFTLASLYVYKAVISARVLEGVGQELVTSQGVVRQFLDQDREFLHAVAMSHGEMVSSLDAGTDSSYYVAWGQHHLEHTEIDLIQLENKQSGEILFTILRDYPEVTMTPVFSSLGKLQFYHDNRHLYQIEAFPLPDGKRVLYAGKRIDSQWIWGLASTTNSQMAIYTGTQFLAVSVDSTMLAPLRETLPWDMSAQDTPYELKIGGQPMMAMCEGLPGSNSPDLCVLLLRDLEPEMAVLAEVRRSITVLAFVIMFIITLIGILAAWSMVRKIRELVRASEAMARGEEFYPLKAYGSDELAQLTRRFMEMRGKLRERHEELVSLNRQLQEQMDQVARAQRQLVQSEKLATMGRLTAQLSHELNNPICNIQNCIEVLNKYAPREGDSREYIQLIQDEIRRMSKLTRQLLDFHRPSKTGFAATDINELISNILKLSQQQFDRKGVEVHTELDPSLPEITGSADQLKQVLLNLVLNAGDAMKEGGKLTIRSEADDGYVVLQIQDTGVGMTEETREKIFDAFFTTKDEVSGVGLGLSVSYSIIRQHGGWIDVDSAPGDGTTFKIRLPLAAAHVQETEIAT